MPTQFLSASRGATAIQYGLIAAMVAIAIAAALPSVSTGINRTMCQISGAGGTPLTWSGTQCLSAQQQCTNQGNNWYNNTCMTPSQYAQATCVAPGTWNGSSCVVLPSAFTTEATCQGAGFVWDATYCDSAASQNTKAAAICASYNSQGWPCTRDGANNYVININSGSGVTAVGTQSCTQWGGAVNTSTIDCILPQGTSATANGCANLVNYKNPDGTCSMVNGLDTTASHCTMSGGTYMASGSYGAWCKFP